MPKVKFGTGRKVVSAAATAERLVAAANTDKYRWVTFSAGGDEGLILGDSDVLFGTPRGLVVSDGTGSASSFQEVTMTVSEADAMGMKNVNSAGWIDLYDIWVDSETSADAVFWFGEKI